MHIYSQLEVERASKNYFKGDELAANIWIKKYCLRNRKNQLLELTPDDMHKRLATEFSRIELNYPNPVSELDIYNLLKDFRYLIAQGSPMYGIGNDYTTTSLSNCFVIGSNGGADSYGSIMRTDEEQIQLMKRRGGVGHDISHLRPSGTMANNSILGSLAGTTLYMERYSNSTREVAQDGRRGALMLSIDVGHPDVDKFIDIKLVQGKVTGANISVKISDEFMEAVKLDKDFWQSFPVDLKIPLGKEYDDIVRNMEYNKLYSIYGGYLKRIKAKELWDKIIKNAHECAEPGILFWDNFKRESLSEGYAGHSIIGVNPCAEICLPAYDSCRLLAINLYSYVKNPFTLKSEFNFDKFKKDSCIAQRLMDDLVDLEIEKLDKIIDKIKSDPEPEDLKSVELNLWQKIKQKAIEGRRTGLGVTAEGDMLAAMGLRYGSKPAIEFSVNVHKILAVESYKSSIQMAKERGCFPIWDKDKEGRNLFLNRIFYQIRLDSTTISPGKIYDVELDPLCSIEADYNQYGRRNISNLTIAPTGTTSLMAQTTSGVEPMFKPYYKRRTRTEDKTQCTFIDEEGTMWREYFVMHPKFKTWLEINKFIKDGIYTFNASNEEELEMIFRQSSYYKASADDIDWEASVRMQGSIQKWVDHSISKTVNVPENTTVETVDQIYRKAYEYGCKGVTIYREGSRSGILVSADNKQDKFEYVNAYKRPKVVDCDIYRKTALKENWVVIVGKVKDKPYEIFVIKDVIPNSEFPHRIEKGQIIKVASEMYTLVGFTGDKMYEVPNLVNLMSSDQGVNTRKYSSMLRHRMHPKFIVEQIEKYAAIGSFEKVIQRVLRNYIKEEEVRNTKEKCPQCGSDLVQEEGCKHCVNCTYSKCS